MLFPKFSFSLSLIAFLLPFLLVTCNNTETKELKPLVMQDQMVYTIQGYKILTNSFDKSGKYGETMDYSSILGSKYEDDMYSSDESDSLPEEKYSRKYDGMRILLIVVFVLVLVGLIFQFFLKHEPVRKKASVIIASVTTALLVSFYVFLEVSLRSGQNKIHEAMGGDEMNSFMSALSKIEPEIGLGSGFYLCMLGQLLVLYYYLFFVKRYTVVKNMEQDIAYSAPTESTPSSSESV